MNKTKTSRKEIPGRSVLLRLLVSAAMLGLFVPLILIVVLHLPPVQKAVIDRLVSEVEGRTGYSLGIGSYRWWPFSKLTLIDLSVKAADKAFLECRTARIDYNLTFDWPHFRPSEVILENPTLHLERDGKGGFRIPPGNRETSANPASADKDRSLALPLPKVRIISGVVDATHDGKAVLAIRDVSGTLTLQKVQDSEGVRIKVDFGQWQGQADLPNWGKWELSGGAEIRNLALESHGIRFALGDKGLVECRCVWDLSPPYQGRADIYLTGFPAEVVLKEYGGLSSLKEVSGLVTVERKGQAFVVEHQVGTNLGDFAGRLELVPAQGTVPQSLKWLVQYSDLKLPAAGHLPGTHLFGSLEMDVKGTELRELAGSFRNRINPSKIGDHVVLSGEISGVGDGGKLSVNGTSIKSTLADFGFSGTLDLRGLWDPQHAGEIKAEVQVDQARLDRIVSKSRQKLGGAVRFEGRYGAGDLDKWQKWQGKLDGNVNVPELISLKVTGSIKNEQLNLDYETEIRDLQKIATLVPDWNGRGRLTSRGNVKGKYPDLFWEGTVQSPLFQYGSIQAEQASLSGKGKITGKDGRREASLKSAKAILGGVKVNSLGLDVQQQDEICKFQLKGEGLFNQLSARLSGRLEKIWTAPRTLVVDQGQFTWKEQGGTVDGRVELDGQRFKIHSLNIQQARQKLRATGEASLDSRCDLQLVAEGINAAQWGPLLGADQVKGGTVSGQIRIGGRSDQPEANVDLQVVNAVIGNREAIDRLRLQGVLARDVFSFQGEVGLPGSTVPADFTGKVPVRLSILPMRFEVRRSEEMSLSAKLGTLNAEHLLPYLPFLEKLGGRIEGEIQCAGSINQPLLRGSGAWRDGRVTVKAWPNPVENVLVEWRADGRQIEIGRAEAQVLGGRVELTGRVDYPSLQAMKLSASGRELKVSKIYGIEGKVSGNAELAETPQGPELTGKLLLSDAEMNLGRLESDLARSIVVVEGDARSEIVEIESGEKLRGRYYNSLKMNLVLDLPPSGVWVRGKGLNAEIVGSLKIEKPAQGSLKLVGGLQALRGSFSFQGKEMKIAQGEVVFLGAPKPDPSLRIMCEKQVKDVIVQVHVTGPVSQPKLTFSSIPAMNQVDVLSYLLFDHPAGDLNSKERVQLQDRASSFLGSQASTVLKQVFGDSPYAPDSLKYRSSTGRSDRSSLSGSTSTVGSSDKGEGGVVEIGKHITPDLYVNYGKGVLGENGNQVQIEYRLNRHLSVQTEIGGTSTGTQQSGVDVFWRHDFGN